MSAVAPLGPADVHVWSIPLRHGPVPETDALSMNERARYGRFRRPADASRFLRRRAAVRSILGAYLGQHGGDVTIDETCSRCGDQHGRPTIVGDGAWLRFSASSSQHLAVVAVASSRPVGLDIEREQLSLDWRSIAARFLHPVDFEVIAAAPERMQCREFLRIWTRTEAQLKRTGIGLRGLETVPTTADADVWVSNLPAAARFVAALAVAGNAPTVHFKGWRPNREDPAC